MKHLWVICLVVLMAGSLLAQNSRPGVYDRAQLLKTYTNYTVSTADTTVWFSYPDLLNCREVYLIAYATDSVHAAVVVMGRNTALPAAATTKYEDAYTDSLGLALSTAGVTTALAPRVRVIPLKDATVDRLEGCNQFRISTIGVSAAHMGTTTGRVLQYYLAWHY
jgi:hypothetical protein